MRITRTQLLILPLAVLAFGFLAFFANFYLAEGFHKISGSQEQWSQFGSYIGGLLGAVFGFLSVILLIFTFYATLDQKDEQFILKHIEHILFLNARIVTIYNEKHPGQKWPSDDGMALVTGKTKDFRGGTFKKSEKPNEIWRMLIEKDHLQVLYEFEQLLAALEYLVYWDKQRAEVGIHHDASGFRSKFRTLIASYMPPNHFTLLYNLSILEIKEAKFGKIPVDYPNRFAHLIEFVARVGPHNPAPEDAA